MPHSITYTRNGQPVEKIRAVRRENGWIIEVYLYQDDDAPGAMMTSQIAARFVRPIRDAFLAGVVSFLTVPPEALQPKPETNPNRCACGREKLYLHPEDPRDPYGVVKLCPACDR